MPPLKAGTRPDPTAPVSHQTLYANIHTDLSDLSFPTEFAIATPYDQPGGSADEWKVGFVNSAPYISAALAGVWREYRGVLASRPS